MASHEPDCHTTLVIENRRIPPSDTALPPSVGMKITAIPQLYRNVNRAVDVISVLSKYGLANWISHFDLEFAKPLLKSPSGDVLARQNPETRIRLALIELGPTFIKLGQVLSTRGDLVGVSLAKELEKLQADVPADPPKVVREIIEAELGQPVDELFHDFHDKPLASASIGQVHRAQLRTGENVVIKVQHHGIEKKIRVDLEILSGLAQLAELSPELKPYRPKATVAEFQRTLLRELDFGREERNLQQFARDFVDDPRIRIPKSFTEYSTSRVLTMEYLDGIKLSHRCELIAAKVDLVEVARRGAELYMEMIFSHGFYHADPHPGNILVMPVNVIGLLDFGMVGRLDPHLQDEISDIVMALAGGDSDQLATVITRVGETPADLDRASFEIDVTEFVTYYAAQRLDEFDLSSALNELTEMIRRYQILLPARIALLLKVLVMLEGTSQLLSPQFNLMDVIVPYQRKILWRRISPKRRIQKFRRIYSEFENLIEVLPRGILDIFQQVQTGKFDVHLDHRGLEPSVNRLVLGMLTSALFLGSSLMLSRNVPPLLPIFGGVSVVGLTGCVLACALALRLLRAIYKSGHLDRRK